MFPASSAVLIAEQRLEQSKQQLRQQLRQTRSTLTKPSSRLIVTGIGVLLGIWLARRKTAIVTSSIAKAWPLVRSTVFALLIRFVAQRMTKRTRADEAQVS
jgi:hypothetical protein